MSHSESQIERKLMSHSSMLATVNYTKAIIRPCRDEYGRSELIDVCPVGDAKSVREDVVVLNPNGKKMFGSLYRAPNPSPSNPVLIFSHGNGQNQLMGPMMMPLPRVLAAGISFFSFDFAGCGNGEEPLITMGIREKDELGCVINHLKTLGFQTIALWGLSMGGFTTVLTTSERDDITVAVIDSAYQSIPEFLKFHMNPIVFRVEYQGIRERVQQEGGFDIEQCDGLKAVATIKVPMCFLASREDRVVDFKQGQRLFNACPSTKKEFIEFHGSHVDLRGEAYDKAVDFVISALENTR